MLLDYTQFETKKKKEELTTIEYCKTCRHTEMDCHKSSNVFKFKYILCKMMTEQFKRQDIFLICYLQVFAFVLF